MKNNAVVLAAFATHPMQCLLFLNGRINVGRESSRLSDPGN
ncbi:MAG TPA: hypothetical protein VK722_06480 [Candidatus Aquilonibacter sp.]|nr:hypothetical protein [Candidatus Aquilonibacter sp.]